MGTAYAADFSATCSTGQTLYYNITDATNHYVEITFPGTSSDSPWEGYTKPTGNITLPSSVTYNNVTYAVKKIGTCAFYLCSGLTGSLTIPNSVTTIDSWAFYDCSGFTGSLIIPNSVTTIGSYAFIYCRGFNGSLTIPNSVTTIGGHAFRNCTGFTGSLTIGSSVTSIGEYAFYCSGFTGSLTIPNSVTTIGGHAFESCSGLTGSLTIGNSVTSIGSNAFTNCSGFTGSLTIGNSVTNIGSYAFEGCSDFASMTVLPETPPTLGTDVFSNVPSDIPVYVPCESLEDYQAASGWSAFTNMQCRETLTVYDGTATSFQIPAYITYFDDFTRSQFVIPADELVEMIGTPITSMTFYTTTQNVPYTTLSDADVYLMEVDYTSISAYEPKESATTVYSGRFSIVSADDGGGMMTINFSTPYVYQGGNLLVGIENVEDNGFKYIEFYGQTVSGASISGRNASSTGIIPANQQNFIPKTTFGYQPTCVPKRLPYTYGFEEKDKFECWTMLDCEEFSGRTTISHHDGDYAFLFFYNTNPPQYLISLELEGTTGVNVSFYYVNSSNDYPESFQVGYSTTTQSPTAFTWGDEVTANDQTTWMLYEDFFPVGTKYIAVKYNSYDQLALFLDDFSFTPVFCPTEDQCELTFELTDSYGDGWNGAAIRVVDEETGIVLATMTNVTHDHANAPITENYTLAVCDGRELRFEWVSGSYDSECSYVVTDVNGDEIFSGSGAMSEPVTYMVDCPETFIFLTDGNWNDGSHWNTGTVPPAGSDVIIQANVTVPAGYLAVANAVSLDGGSITVADGGQLKHNTLDLMVTMKKNIAGYDDANSQNNYYLLAVPFLSVQVPTAMTANPGSDFYRFDPSESGAEWRNHKQEPITFVQRRYGYLYANPESVELSLTGITLSVSNEFTMSYTVDYIEGSDSPYNGWALLGNPFTYNAYVYRFGSNNEFVPMPIMMYDEEGELQTIYGGPVAPMQGFFVHVTETTTVYFSGTGLHEDDYVDLGLPSGLLWATCNVGASAPEDYGNYYAWGETTPKDTYNWSTYQYCNGSNSTMTKYCTNADYGNNGFTDNLTTLLPEDDAAAANWGGNWRMPTKEEFQELYNNTTVTWTQQNGVNGRLFTASNGNSLFLPAAGYRSGSSLYDAGSWGDYWLSSLDTDNPYCAWYFHFYSDYCSMYYDYRYCGQSVRAVRVGSQN
jgi:hypothetical protein